MCRVRNTAFLSAIEPLFLALSAHPVYTVFIVPLPVPLVLIDGIPGELGTVAPEDVESVDVLKDGSAAAIYGTRGTNGVILITTKQAKGVDINQVEYNG